MKQSIEMLDSGFDSLNIHVPSEEKQPVSKLAAHCDCLGANELFFNERMANRDEDGSYSMVPTEAKDSHCVHCGYHVVVQPVGDYKMAFANRKNSQKAKAKREASGAKVVGKHVETGEVVEFPTAKAAYEAGFGSVVYALKIGRAVNGYEWRRA